MRFKGDSIDNKDAYFEILLVFQIFHLAKSMEYFNYFIFRRKTKK